MDNSVKPPNYTRYAGDFLSACNGPSSPNHSHPPPQYTPSASYLVGYIQGAEFAKQTEYYSTRPKPTQESANSTRQDEYHYYRTSPNFYHNRDPPVGPNVRRMATQNVYHCYQSNPEFYHNRRDDSNIASTAAQGVPVTQAAATTEYKLGQMAQQRDFYYARSQEAPARGSVQWDYTENFMQQTNVTAMRDAYYNRRPDQGNIRKYIMEQLDDEVNIAFFSLDQIARLRKRGISQFVLICESLVDMFEGVCVDSALFTSAWPKGRCNSGK
ncbi:hypothetical protein CDV55_101227 [Aspergillus turcosus]|nr:hypothetical protein CDV55_101227 [Aspergillus turcosus]